MDGMIGYGCRTTKAIETVYARATTSGTSRQPPIPPTATSRIDDPTSIIDPKTPGPVAATPTPTSTLPAPSVKSSTCVSSALKKSAPSDFTPLSLAWKVCADI